MNAPYGVPQDVIDGIMALRGRLHVFDRFEPAQTALLVLNMQNFHIGEAAAIARIIPRINRIACVLREQGGTVIWIGMTVGEAKRSLFRCFHEHFLSPERAAAHRDQLTPGHHGHEFHHDLDMRVGDVIVHTSRFSGFVEGASDLHATLRRRGVQNLIVTGTQTNLSCESTARDAMMRGLRVAMVADATFAHHHEAHIAGLSSIFTYFGDVRSTNEVIGDLLGDSARFRHSA
jgi:nicotinamidase-related amidase